ncbi:MAG: hypothetical protein LBB31_01875, partial [Prevotellaceae bacterium]|nr:hypothetical protein [Prevotellaceae bacterium]
MKKSENKKSGKLGKIGISAFPIILLCLVLAIAIYVYVYGAPSHFEGGLLPDGSVNPDFDRWDSH